MSFKTFESTFEKVHKWMHGKMSGMAKVACQKVLCPNTCVFTSTEKKQKTKYVNFALVSEATFCTICSNQFTFGFSWNKQIFRPTPESLLLFQNWWSRRENRSKCPHASSLLYNLFGAFGKMDIIFNKKFEFSAFACYQQQIRWNWVLFSISTHTL